MKEYVLRMRARLKAKQVYSARILNNLGEKIHQEQKKRVEKLFTFRAAHTKKFTLNAILLFKTSKNRPIAKQDVKLFTRKNNKYLAMHDAGARISARQQKTHFTTTARGGSYRNLPKQGKSFGKLSSARGLSLASRAAYLRSFKSSGELFYLPSRKGKQGGVFRYIHGKLRQIRSWARKPITIKRSGWHTDAVRDILRGKTAGSIVKEAVKRYFS